MINSNPETKPLNMQKQKQKQKKKRKWELSESQLGYAMIAPAIIIILMIALYPVLKSFWYSMFDYRLNNATKNGTFLSYKLNMEKYFGNIDDSINALSAAVDGAKGEEKQKLSLEMDKLNASAAKVKEINAVSSKEAQVRKFTDSYLPVTDDKLVYAAIDKKTAVELLSDFKSIQSDLQNMKSSENVRSDVEKAEGLAEELTASVISPNFVGLKNYTYYLNPKNTGFWGAISYTFLFTVISVSCELLLGMIVALVINRSFRGRGIVRAAVLVPWAIPTVVAAMIWKFLYDGQTGFMSHLFASLHLIENSGVLLTTHIGTTFAVVFADVWKTSPYMALLILAGLQGIDSSLYEATSVDGANKWQQFFRITLPMLKPTLLVALLFRTLDAFRIFDLVMVLTGGSNGTETISSYAYKTMFSQMEFGRGSTLSFIVFLCVAIISIGYIKILGANVLSNER